MKPQDLNGKAFAVLIAGQTAAGEDDWAVFGGTLSVTAGGVLLQRDSGPPFAIRTEWLERIKPVTSEVRDILLGAEFYLPLTIGPLAEGESAASYVETGLRWPT